MAAVEHSHYVAYVRLRIREMCLFTEAALMRRIAVLAAGLVLVAAAQAPAAAVPGSATGPVGVVAAKASPKPSTKPTSKPSKSKAPPTPSVPVPVATEPGPSQQCSDSNQVTSKVKSLPWAQKALDWSSAWPLTEGRGIKVAVVDSGVDGNPQLAGKVTAIDLTGTGFQDCSGEGHGTAIAGIIAASVQVQGNPFEGVAPEAKILSVKVFTQTQQSNSSATLAQGIRDATLLGAQVINVSMTTRSSLVLRSAVDFALSRNVVIVASGGNDDQQNGVGPFYPANYPGVLSVGALEPNGSLAPFSDQRSHVAVTAPGVSITSTAPGGYSVNSLNGTSFATAFVSGVAALVRSRYPSLTGPEVVARIKQTADGSTGPGTGDGLVNPLQAVTAIVAPATAQTPSPTPGPQAVSVDQAPPPDLDAQRTALEVTAITLGLAGLIAIGAVVIREGRRRRWRSGSLPARTDDRTRGPGRPDPR
jgi:type VII secretion-associated serine protease mycosin